MLICLRLFRLHASSKILLRAEQIQDLLHHNRKPPLFFRFNAAVNNPALGRQSPALSGRVTTATIPCSLVLTQHVGAAAMWPACFGATLISAAFICIINAAKRRPDAHEWRLIKIGVKPVLMNEAFNWTFGGQVLEGVESRISFF